MMVVEKTTAPRPRRRSSSVQRMLELEQKHKLDRMKAAPPPKPKQRPLLTDPPRKRMSAPAITPRRSSLQSQRPRDSNISIKAEPSEDTGRRRSGEANPERGRPSLPTNSSYSARARESMATAATSRTVIPHMEAQIYAGLDPPDPVCPPPGWVALEKPKKDKKKTEAAKKDARRGPPTPRLVKAPPSASRTLQLQSRVTAPATAPVGPKPKPIRPHSFNALQLTKEPSEKTRPRSASRNSLGSVTSLTARLFERPRGRSVTRQEDDSSPSSSGFLGGIKLRKEQEADTEFINRQTAMPSYDVPARHLYRQPGGTGTTRPHSRASSVGAVSSTSLAPHIVPNPPAMPFPQQGRYRAPPISLRKPRPISRSRSRSRSPLRSRDESREPRSPQTSSGSAPAGAKNVDGETRQENFVNDEAQKESPGMVDTRTQSTSSLAYRRHTTLGSQVPSPWTETSGRSYPPSASVSTATLGDAAQRRPTSFLGRFRHSQQSISEQPSGPGAPARTERRSRSRSAIRNLTEAARNVFHRRRSSSLAANFQRDSVVPSGQVSPAVPGTSGTASPFPDVFGTPNVSRGAGTRGQTDDADPWAAQDLDVDQEWLRPPEPGHLARLGDHSSVSSYDTMQSHRHSTNTPNTSRPQSEKGALSTVGAGDGQKVLAGNNKPALAPPAGPSVSPLRGPSTPPLGPKSSRRALRLSTGSDGPALTQTRDEGKEQRTSQGNQPVELDGEGTQILTLTAKKRRPSALVIDSSLYPKPLNISPLTPTSGRTASDKSTERSGWDSPSRITHRARRHTANFAGASMETPSPLASDSRVSLASRDSPPKQGPPVAYLEQMRKVNSSTPGRRNGSPRPNPAGRMRPTTADMPSGDMLTKVLVECCSCKHYLEMPNRVHERLVSKRGGNAGHDAGSLSSPTEVKGLRVGVRLGERVDLEKASPLAVRCPWCRHEMGVKCCAGYVAVLHLKERLH